MLLPLGASVLCLGICLPLFFRYQKALQPRLAAVFKSLGTCCALLLALVAALRLNPVCWCCALALLLHAAADYALEFTFPVGVVLFLAGHIAYIAFFLQVLPLTITVALCLLGLLAIGGILLWQWRTRIKNQMKLFILYGVVLCVMCAMGLGGGLSVYSLSSAFIAAAATLFFLSDLLLLRNLLFPSSRALNWIVMITYYLAQLLFGLSCLYL